MVKVLSDALFFLGSNSRNIAPDRDSVVREEEQC